MPSDKGEKLLGKGMARKAAKQIKQRQARLDAAIAAMSEGQSTDSNNASRNTNETRRD